MKRPNARIFLDGNSTTPVDPRVARVMCASYSRALGNPSSVHRAGWRSRYLLEKARQNVAELLGREDDEIFFVPSVTLALNILIQGVVGMRPGCRIAASRAEHKSILTLISYACNRWGCEWIDLEVNEFGVVEPAKVAEVAGKGVDVFCISHGSGETGALNSIEEIVQAIGGRAPLVLDASQTAAYLDMAATRGADCVILSGHKLYGPRGMSAFCKRRRLEVVPTLIGAGQEGGLVPGTVDVPGAVALGVAAKLALREGAVRKQHVNELRDRFASILEENVNNVMFNGPHVDRVPGNLSVTIPGVPAELLIRRLPQLSFSRASACSGNADSHVLRALGFSKRRAACTFRIGFNCFNTGEEVELAAEAIVTEIQKFNV